MLTADEIEALRSFAKRALAHARREFGAGMPTAAEIEAERRGEEKVGVPPCRNAQARSY